jgi:shikimate kinase
VTPDQTIQPCAESAPIPAFALDRSLVLIGLMGAGKTRVGRRLAERLGLSFIDADQAIEADTGKSISDLFAAIGEPAFREGERRMIARLLQGPVAVIATGGGAYMDIATRRAIRERGVSIWLRADLETLVARTARSNRRPLLEGVDRAQKLAELMAIRHPAYAEAELIIDSHSGPVDQTVDSVMAALAMRQGLSHG